MRQGSSERVEGKNPQVEASKNSDNGVIDSDNTKMMLTNKHKNQALPSQ